jgi:hypothetical protein
MGGLLGISDKNWEDAAAQVAIKETKKPCTAFIELKLEI